MVGEDKKHVLFHLLVCAYKVMNLSYVGEKVLNSAPQKILNTNFYDLMESDEKMTLSMVKE
jgi:hypothetical protein